jgi:hypothetical protein
MLRSTTFPKHATVAIMTLFLLLAQSFTVQTATTFVDAFSVSPNQNQNAVLPKKESSIETTFSNPMIDAFNSKIMTATAALITSNTFLVPIVQAIVEDDNYEYGAVDAPIGIAVGGGILAILTALLPVALKGGEEAFEEIKDRDVDTFGKRNTDLLSGKKKK